VAIKLVLAISGFVALIGAYYGCTYDPNQPIQAPVAQEVAPVPVSYVGPKLP
jgi:hypothetical protein